jgi:hypothetical protein
MTSLQLWLYIGGAVLVVGVGLYFWTHRVDARIAKIIGQPIYDPRHSQAQGFRDD